MVTVLALFTCFNRKEKTEKSIRSIVRENSDCDFTFIAVDDNSTDGTLQMLMKMRQEYTIHIVEGDGGLFYSGGMRMAMKYAKETLGKTFDYVLMMNDDVLFLNQSISHMVTQSLQQKDAIVVGAIKDDFGRQSYGAIKYVKGTQYRKLSPEEWEIQADTFNANCVLIPWRAFNRTQVIDSYYIHSLGDFDYGLALKRNGYKIYSFREYAGICNNNSNKGSWTDVTLPRKVRIRKKESIKGAPTKQWFHFLKKNFGLAIALKGCATSYIRILLGK